MLTEVIIRSITTKLQCLNNGSLNIFQILFQFRTRVVAQSLNKRAYIKRMHEGIQLLLTLFDVLGAQRCKWKETFC